jgi:hypothetical protein
VKSLHSFLAVVLSVYLATASANASTVVVSEDTGGLVSLYQMRWADLAAKNVKVQISGTCASACTVLLGYIPNQNICVTQNGALGFHWATVGFVTAELWQLYPQDIRDWITKHGGLTQRVIWLQAPEIFRYFRKCGT